MGRVSKTVVHVTHLGIDVILTSDVVLAKPIRSLNLLPCFSRIQSYYKYLTHSLRLKNASYTCHCISLLLAVSRSSLLPLRLHPKQRVVSLTPPRNHASRKSSAGATTKPHHGFRTQLRLRSHGVSPKRQQPIVQRPRRPQRHHALHLRHPPANAQNQHLRLPDTGHLDSDFAPRLHQPFLQHHAPRTPQQRHAIPAPEAVGRPARRRQQRARRE